MKPCIEQPEFVENSDSTAEINKYKDDHPIDVPQGASLLKNETGTKTLGLNWNPLTDTFNINIYKDLVNKNPLKKYIKGHFESNNSMVGHTRICRTL